MLFFSMGMFILDTIHLPEINYEDVIGGAGTYAALGAGMLLDKAERHEVGFILDKGHDFPEAVLTKLRSWNMGIVERETPNRATTRGLNVFGANEQRDFEYLTPKLQIQATDLIELGDPAKADCIHLICSPSRCLNFVSALKTPNQILVWEPVPTECVPGQWTNFLRAAQDIDVVSPNALEAAHFVGESEPLTKEGVEQLVQKHYSNYNGFLVIRCGGLGAYARGLGWYAPYHTSSTKVVDPSGAGNSFMGGLGLGLAKFKHDKHMAMVYACVAASLVIEQVGPPTYNGATDTWNGTYVSDRIVSYLERFKQTSPAS